MYRLPGDGGDNGDSVASGDGGGRGDGGDNVMVATSMAVVALATNGAIDDDSGDGAESAEC